MMGWKRINLCKLEGVVSSDMMQGIDQLVNAERLEADLCMSAKQGTGNDLDQSGNQDQLVQIVSPCPAWQTCPGEPGDLSSRINQLINVLHHISRGNNL